METTGEGSIESNWLTSDIFCISLATKEKEWVFWLDEHYEQARVLLLGILAQSDLKKVFHNAKNDLHYIERTFGIRSSLWSWETIEDTALLGHLYRNLDWKNLEGLAGIYLGYEPWKKETEKIGRKLRGYQHVPREQMTEYTARDARATIDLYHWYVDHMYPEAWSCYALEKQVMGILFEMERRGVTIDRDKLETMKGLATTRRDEQATTLRSALGVEELNLRSGVQLARAIEAHPEIELEFARTPTGKASFAKDKVAEYAVHVPAMGLLSTYHKLNDVIDYLDELEAITVVDGRVHCLYNQVGAKTFRMSCKKANLQNIPREDTINALGVEGLPTIRQLFTPDQCFYSYDFSQIEMVLYAHYTRDAVLIEAVSNGDVHAESARRITGKAVITPQDRFLFGKKVNFAVIYGAGGSRLAKEISIAQGSIYPPHKGMQLLDRFYKAYPRAKVLQQGVAKRIDERGYIVTTLGRRLYVDPDKAYKGVNYLIQGGGAELLKLAQVAIQREFPGTQVLVVHDQIVLDTELEERDQLRVKELMESCLQLSLPIKASLDSSSVSWGHTGH